MRVIGEWCMVHKCVIKREIAPDPVYGNVLISKFINCLLKKGKKSVAESIFYGAIDQIKGKASGISMPNDEGFAQTLESVSDDLHLFYLALYNITPKMEVCSKRVGGATYQIPIEVSKARAQALSFRWLIKAAMAGSARTMKAKLAKEILDAANNSGIAVKKKEDTHKMARANKAFSHYRW